MAKDETGLDAPMRAAISSVGIVGCALAAGGLFISGPRVALGVAIGAAIATANLWVFAKLGKAFLDPKATKGPWLAVAFLKLVILFGGVWWILKTGTVNGLPVAVGYGALPLGITIGTILGPKPPEE
jgi:hypothetical protein